MSKNDNNAEIFLFNFIVAGVTSSLAKTITAPIDRIKLILQNQNSAAHILTGERQRYKGLIDCLRRLPKEQGTWSLWRGNGANLIRYIPSQALNFSFHDIFMNNLHVALGDSSKVQTMLLSYLSGFLAGACSVFTMYPLKFCQTRLSLDMGSVTSTSTNTQKGHVKREFNGLIDCFRKITKREGIPGVYSGFPLALLGSSLYRALYFGMFDTLKQSHAYFWFPQDEVKKLPVATEFLFAQTVTAVAGFSTYPFDTVGRRIMMQSGQPKELRLFDTAWHAFRLMYIHERFSSFYKGAWVNCIKGMCGALVLVFYDEVLYYTKWKDRMKNVK